MRRCLPLLSVFFSQTSKEMQSAYVMSLMLSMGCQFLQKHFLGIFLWAVGFFYYGMNPVAEMPSIIWYALSIPYLLYLTHQLVAYYVRFNKEHQYVFFQETFQDRFVVFLHWFLDATIIIFLFREVFILTTYSKSGITRYFIGFLFNYCTDFIAYSDSKRRFIKHYLTKKSMVGSSMAFYRSILLSHVGRLCNYYDYDGPSYRGV
jgi:hypothetical protein